MPTDAQSAIALLAVAFAIAYLTWRGVQIARNRRSTGCGSSCGGCPSASSADASFVQITKKKAP